jgi:hypothetical protein
MRRTYRWMFLILALLLAAQLSAQTKPHRKSHHKAPPKQVVLPPLPPGPLPQLPLDLMPAAPPKVTYQNGLLTIVAQNSTLGDILRAVHKLTGASIDAPTNPTERVVTRLGPGAPRDVLATLLNGSSYNYVMLGSTSDPTAVASVVLTTRPASGTAPTTASTSQPPPPVYGQQMPVPQPIAAQQVPPQPAATETDDNANADDPDASDENAGQDQPGANGAAQQVPPQPQPPNAGPKTPEQILEMLRRQQPTPSGQPGVPPTPPQQQPEN